MHGDGRRAGRQEDAGGGQPQASRPRPERDQRQPAEGRGRPHEGRQPEHGHPRGGGQDERHGVTGLETARLEGFPHGEREAEEEQCEKRLLERPLGDVGDHEVGHADERRPGDPQRQRRLPDPGERHERQQHRRREGEPGEGGGHADAGPLGQSGHRRVRADRVAVREHLPRRALVAEHVGLAHVEPDVVEHARAQLADPVVGQEGKGAEAEHDHHDGNRGEQRVEIGSRPARARPRRPPAPAPAQLPPWRRGRGGGRPPPRSGRSRRGRWPARSRSTRAGSRAPRR